LSESTADCPRPARRRSRFPSSIRLCQVALHRRSDGRGRTSPGNFRADPRRFGFASGDYFPKAYCPAPRSTRGA
jgi:hypothetical protein